MDSVKPRFCEYFWRKLRTRKCFVTDEAFVREGLPCTDRLPLGSAALFAWAVKQTVMHMLHRSTHT